MRHGFIREEKDIKYLILFSMTFLPFAISESDLLDIVLIDDAFGYFEFSQAFAQLQETKHVAAVDAGSEKLYILTPKGQEVIETMARQLPSSVRDKAEKAALRVVMKIRRDASIKASHRENPDGTFTVQLKICDKDTEHLAIDMMVVTQRQCTLLEENFRRNAEKIYKDVINLLSTGGQDE